MKSKINNFIDETKQNKTWNLKSFDYLNQKNFL